MLIVGLNQIRRPTSSPNLLNRGQAPSNAELHYKLAHQRREVQLLPFVREQLTETQRGILMQVIRKLAGQEHSSGDLDFAAALVMTSLETGCHVHDFLWREKIIYENDAGKRISKKAWHELGRDREPRTLTIKPQIEIFIAQQITPSEKSAQGLYHTPQGEFGLWLNVPRLSAKDADNKLGQPTQSWTYRSKIWLPLSAEARNLILRAERKFVGLSSCPTNIASVERILRPLAKICEQQFGLKISDGLLQRVHRDLAVQISNAPRGDPVRAKLATGQLVREAGSASHYSAYSRRQVARQHMELLSSRPFAATFVSNPTHDHADDMLVIDPGQGVKTRSQHRKGIPTQADLDNLRTNLQWKINDLERRIANVGAEKGATHFEDQVMLRCEQHNWLTLYVWLMTSVVIGARKVVAPLINPCAVIPGDLILIGEKAPKEDAQGRVDPNPTTRVVALPRHVLNQFRAYYSHCYNLAPVIHRSAREGWRE